MCVCVCVCFNNPVNPKKDKFFFFFVKHINAQISIRVMPTQFGGLV